MQNRKREIRICSKPQEDSLKVSKLRFTEPLTDRIQTNDQFMNWRPPVIKKGKQHDRLVWWAEYQYRVPAPLRDRYPGKTFERFRVYEDINRLKSEEYNRFLLDSINTALKAGHNPFADELRAYHEERNAIKGELTKSKNWDITGALNFFLTKWADRTTEGSTMGRYKTACGHLISWLKDKGLQFMPAQDITFQHIEMALAYHSKLNSWGPKNYNNNLGFLRTAFKTLKKYNVIDFNPCEDVDKKKTKSSKHKYYNPTEFKMIGEVMAEHDPYTKFASQVVYHLCLRSEFELQGLQVKHILRDRKAVFISKDVSKTDADAYIPMNDEILAIFEQRKVFDYPPDYYVFTKLSGGKFIPDGTPGAVPFGREFFSHRFSNIRKKAGLGQEYTLYGFKHTRAVHFIQDGGKLEELMMLCRHSNLGTTIQYLRDLGETVDAEKIRANSRKY